jgi:hypothetical protein
VDNSSYFTPKTKNPLPEPDLRTLAAAERLTLNLKIKLNLKMR